MIIALRGVAQVVERYFREVEAASSSLVTQTIKANAPFCHHKKRDCLVSFLFTLLLLSFYDFLFCLFPFVFYTR